jgi:hypothetical protein
MASETRKQSAAHNPGAATADAFAEPAGTNLGDTEPPGWSVLESAPEPWPVYGQSPLVAPAADQAAPEPAPEQRAAAPVGRRTWLDYWRTSENGTPGGAMLWAIRGALRPVNNSALATPGAAQALMAESVLALIGVALAAALLMVSGAISAMLVLILMLFGGVFVGTFGIGLRRYRNTKKRP